MNNEFQYENFAEDLYQELEEIQRLDSDVVFSETRSSLSIGCGALLTLICC